MPAIRVGARENPSWTVDDLCEFIRAEAQREKTQKWYRTLRYLWQAEPWLLNGGLARLRSDGDDGPTVREIVGSPFGAKHQWVQSALRDRTATIEPGAMLTWILQYATASATARAPKVKKGGRPPGAKNSDTDQRLWLAAALQFLGIKEYAMAQRLYPNCERYSAEGRTDQLLRRNRSELDQRKQSLTRQTAEDLASVGMS
jgi:hypothetical protein